MKTNFGYIAKILYKFDRIIFILFALCILIEMALPYVGILLPKFVIQGIVGGAGIDWWMKIFLVFGIGGTALYLTDRVCGQGFKAHMTAARNGCFGDMLNNKMMKIQYKMLEQPEIQELCFRANMLFWSENSGVMGVFNSLKNLIAGVLSLIILVGIISQFGLILPPLLVLLTLLDIYLMNTAKKNEIEQQPVSAEKEREKAYIDKTIRDINCGRDIRIYNLSGWLRVWYERIGREQGEVYRKVQGGYRRARLGTAGVSFLRDAAIYGLLIFLVMEHRLGIDDFVLYLSCSSSFTSTFIKIIDEFMDVKKFLVFTEDFRRVMELEEDGQKRGRGDKDIVETICLKNINYKYPNTRRPALENINLTIKKGERIVIVGANGAGKTTLIKILIGLYEPDNGELKIYNPDKKPIEKEKRTALFSVVMQKIFQYAFSIEENVTFQETALTNPERMRKALQDSGFIKELHKFPKGLATNLRKDFDPEGVSLSSGQAQMLALARAIYKDAPVIVLDEPTASLDPIAEAEIYESFERIFSEKICIFVSHRLSSVRFCDRILLLEQGRIAASGSHEELLKTSDLYAKMWYAQSRPYKRKQV